MLLIEYLQCNRVLKRYVYLKFLLKDFIEKLETSSVLKYAVTLKYQTSTPYFRYFCAL